LGCFERAASDGTRPTPSDDKACCGASRARTRWPSMGPRKSTEQCGWNRAEDVVTRRGARNDDGVRRLPAASGASGASPCAAERQVGDGGPESQAEAPCAGERKPRMPTPAPPTEANKGIERREATLTLSATSRFARATEWLLSKPRSKLSPWQHQLAAIDGHRYRRRFEGIIEPNLQGTIGKQLL